MLTTIRTIALGSFWNETDSPTIREGPVVPLACSKDGVLFTSTAGSTPGTGVFVGAADTDHVGTNDGQLTLAQGYYLDKFDGLIKPREANTYREIIPQTTHSGVDDIISSTIENVNFRGAHFVILISNMNDNFNFIVEAQERSDDTWYPILESGEINTNGTVILKIYPGFTPVPNQTANDFLPTRSRMRVERNGGTAGYLVGVNLVI